MAMSVASAAGAGVSSSSRLGLWPVFAGVMQRDLLLAIRRRSDVLTTFFFFIIVVSLFPLGVGPEPDTLREIAPGVVWVAALLASMLALGRLLAADFIDGTLEQTVLAPQPLAVLVLAKILAHWVVTGAPLVLIAPLLGLQFDLPGDALAVMTAGLLLGTPVLSLVGAIGAALTLGARGGGGLLALLVLPLYIPVLVFGAGAVSASASGMPAGAHLSLLGAFFLAALVFAPWATAAAIRIALE
jgi:heme exporter protein B